MTQEQKAEHDYDRAKDEAAERHGDDVSAILRHEYEAHWFIHQNDPRLARVQYERIVQRLLRADVDEKWSTSPMSCTHELGFSSEYHRLRAENKRLRDTLEMLANWNFGGSLSKQRMQEIARTALQEDDNDTQ